MKDEKTLFYWDECIPGYVIKPNPSDALQSLFFYSSTYQGVTVVTIICCAGYEKIGDHCTSTLRVEQNVIRRKFEPYFATISVSNINAAI